MTLSLAMTAQTRYDLLVQGGRVVDAKNGLDAVLDVAIKDGRIAAVAANLDPKLAAKVLDARGLLVTPGLVDIHAHLFTTTGVPGVWAGENSIRPDDFSFRAGVTTMADAGSAGWRNFEQFKFTVIDQVKTRVFAFINIAGYGMLSNFVEQHPEDMLPEEVARLGKKYPEIVVGVKTAHFESPEWTAVDRALEAGRLLSKPIMVDFGYFRAERPYYQLVGEKLRPGDITTHAFRAPAAWLDGAGKLHPYLEAARRRGVIFDVGHGGGSFAWRNAAPAVAQGFWPDTISTDLHTGSMNGTMMDMPTTMSKFLALGMPLPEVIARSTWRPAQVISHTEVGHLSVGAEADLAAFRLLEGDFGFLDSDQGRLTGKQRLLCELTLRAGKVVWDWNGRAGVPWEQLPKNYGVRPGEFSIAPPNGHAH